MNRILPVDLNVKNNKTSSTYSFYQDNPNKNDNAPPVHDNLNILLNNNICNWLLLRTESSSEILSFPVEIICLSFVHLIIPIYLLLLTHLSWIQVSFSSILTSCVPFLLSSSLLSPFYVPSPLSSFPFLPFLCPAPFPSCLPLLYPV